MPATLSETARAAARRLWEFHTAVNRRSAGHHDLLLVLGSHDLRVAEHAARLWEAGRAPLVLLTGDRGRRTNGEGDHERWQRPEAEVFAEVMRRNAPVPESALLLETRAGNTGENFTLGRELVSERGHEVRRAVVTAKPYMGRRALATAAVHWPEVAWTFDAFPGGYDGYPTDAHTEAELLHFLVGDLQRLDGYARRGWSAPVTIPDTVWRAHDELVALGFTDHAITTREEGTR